MFRFYTATGQLLLIILIKCYIISYLSIYVSGHSFDKIDVIVAQDGSGNYTKIQHDVQAAPSHSKQRYNIKVKAGIYREQVTVGIEKTCITLIGEGMYKTRIIDNRSAKSGYSTYMSATVGIRGHDFVGVDLSFENDAGPENGQAVALRSEAQSSFYRCSFLGFQDTLYAKMGRQFYRECHIYGTIDFIFGDAAMVLQYCTIYVRKPLANQYNVITAQGREKVTGDGGIIFHLCNITAAPDFKRYQTTFQTYLGRPWKIYSRVVIIKSYICSLIHRRGWIKWNDKTRVDKVYYAEYDNQGPGNATVGRVKWSKILKHSSEVIPFSPRNFIQGEEWISAIGIPVRLDI